MLGFSPYTEAELGDYIANHHREMYCFGGEWDSYTLHREAPFLFGVRPDFLQVGILGGRPTVCVIELKLSASVRSVYQTALYLKSLELHYKLLPELAKELPENVDFHAALVAQKFDRFVPHMAEVAEICLATIDPERGVEDAVEFCQYVEPPALDDEFDYRTMRLHVDAFRNVVTRFKADFDSQKEVAAT